MTKTEFEHLKTPVIFHEKHPAAGTINYYRITGVAIGKRITLYWDLQVVTAYGKFRHIHFFSKGHPFHLLHTSSLERFTKIPWPRAKREMLNLLLGTVK